MKAITLDVFVNKVVANDKYSYDVFIGQHYVARLHYDERRDIWCDEFDRAYKLFGIHNHASQAAVELLKAEGYLEVEDGQNRSEGNPNEVGHSPL